MIVDVAFPGPRSGRRRGGHPLFSRVGDKCLLPFEVNHGPVYATLQCAFSALVVLRLFPRIVVARLRTSDVGSHRGFPRRRSAAQIIVLSGSDVGRDAGRQQRSRAHQSPRRGRWFVYRTVVGWALRRPNRITLPVNRRRSRSLPLANIQTDVSVRPPKRRVVHATLASENRSAARHPDEQRILKKSGPGAVIRIDGFSGGRPRRAIRSAHRRARDAYSRSSIGWAGRVEIRRGLAIAIAAMPV